MLTNENDSRSSDPTIRPKTDATTLMDRVGPPNDSILVVENDSMVSRNPSSNLPLSSVNELMDAKFKEAQYEFESLNEEKLQTIYKKYN